MGTDTIEGVIASLKGKNPQPLSPNNKGGYSFGGGQQLDLTPKPEKNGFQEFSNDTQDMKYDTLNSGERVARFENYITGTDNNERLAQQQTPGERWANGIAKFGGKTFTAILGGTIGVVDSLVEGIAKGSLSEAYNSKFNQKLDDLNIEMSYKLPSLYTEQERNAGFFGQMTQANFYADKILGGASFMTGAIVSEALWGLATGGTGNVALTESLLAKASKWTAEGLGGESKVVSALQKMKDYAKGLTQSAIKTEAVAGEGALMGEFSANAINKTIKNFNYSKIPNIVLTATRSAGFEAGMEARLYMKQTEANWLDRYQKEKGHEPTSEEYADFKNTLTNSANAVFLANMPILAVSNGIQFKNALFGTTVSNAIENSTLKRTLFGLGYNTVEKAGERTLEAIASTKGQRILGKTWGLGRDFFTEGYEEMAQGVVSGTADNYMMNGYNRDKTKSTYDTMDAFSDAVTKQFGTTEGLTEGFIGGLTGVLGNVVGGAVRTISNKDAKFNPISQEREDLQKQIDYSNEFTAKNLLDNVVTNNKMQGSQELKDRAISKKDIVGAKLADTESMLAVIERNKAIGGLESGVKDFQFQIEHADLKEVKEQLGLDTEEQAKAFLDQKLQEHKDLVVRHSKNLDFATALLGEQDFASNDKTLNTRDMQRAIAHQITLGQEAHQVNSDLISHIKDIVAEHVSTEGVSNAFDVQQVLDQAPQEKLNLVKRLKVEKINLANRLKTLQVSLLEAGKIKDKEGATTRQDKLVDISKQIQEIEQSVQKNTDDRQVALDALGINQYTDNKNITVESFDNQQANVAKLKSTIDDIQRRNPEQHLFLKQLLAQQSKAVQHAKNYDTVVKAINDPKTRVKLLNGWLSNLLNKNTKLNESTAAHFTDILNNFKKDTAIVFQETTQTKQQKKFEAGEEVDEKYTQNLRDLVKSGQTLDEIDQKILDKADGNEVASMEAPDKVKELEKERDDKIAELEKTKTTTSEKVGEDNNAEIDEEIRIVEQEYNLKVKELGQEKNKIQEEIEGEVIQNTNFNNEKKRQRISEKYGIVFQPLSSYESTTPEGQLILNKLADKIETIVNEKYSEEITKITQSINTLSEELATKKAKINRRRISAKTINKNNSTEVNNQISKVKAEYTKKIAEIKPQETDQLQILRDKVKELTSTLYDTHYIGDALSQENRHKPKDSDVEEYETLLSKWNRKAEKSLTRIISRPSDYKYKDLGLNTDEIDRLKKLNKLLGNWMSLVGTDVGNGESVADLLERINALEATINADETHRENTEKDFVTVVEVSEEYQEEKKNTNTRGGQSQSQALRSIVNGNYRWSHTSLKLFTSYFKEEDIKEVIPSTLGFAIELNNGKIINATYNSKGGFDTTKAEWDNIESDSIVLIKNFNTMASAINKLIGLDSQGNEQYQVVNGDTTYLQTNGSNIPVDTDELNKTKFGETIQLFVSTTDKYNDETETLRNKTDKTANEKRDLAERDAKYHIYMYRNGKLIGNVPGNYIKNSDGSIDEKEEGVGLPLLQMRRNAKEYVAKQIAEGKSGLIPLPYTLKAGISFIGQPNLILQKDADGNITTKQIEFDENSLKLVVGTGYILNGNIVSNADVQVKQFVSKLSLKNKDKKVPIIIFDYLGKNVAFPIDLISEGDNRSGAVIEMLNSSIENKEKIKQFIQALTDAKIDPNQFGLDYTNSEDFTSQTDKLEKALGKLSELTKVVDMEDFAKKTYRKEDLQKDATIALQLDDVPFLSSKLMISISDEITDVSVPLKDQVEELKQREVQSIKQLAEVAKILTSDLLSKENAKIYENLEGDYTDNLVSEIDIPLGETNFIQDKAIVKALQKATSISNKNLSGENTRILKIPKIVKDRMGKPLLNSLKVELENLDNIREKLSAIKTEIKDRDLAEKAKEATICP